jgi:hypothetical protein
VPEMIETDVGSLKLKSHTVKYFNFKKQMKEVPTTAPDFYYVPRDSGSGNKYMDISNVSPSHLVNMQSEENEESMKNDDEEYVKDKRYVNSYITLEICVCVFHAYLIH